MTFQTLDYIIAIAEEQSISKAADRLLLAREQNEMHLTDA